MAGRHRVQWALPTTSKADDNPSELAAVKFANLLYQRPWSELETTQPPFGISRIRTPVFRAPGNDLTQGDQENSASVVKLFNSIKENTLPPRPSVRRGPYTLEAIHHAYSDVDNDDHALVLSGSADDPILQLNQDYRLRV